ncbi:MAG: nicotinamide-nucleotide amidohydrolase family protein [Pseudomonadota bacterium]
MAFDDEVLAQAAGVLDAAHAAGLKLTAAESCTGGLILGGLTEIAGSSRVVDGGFVTYSNTAKNAVLGVPAALLAVHGAVSEPVARAMAEGALAKSGVDVAVAVTGIAGPGGGSPGKPVGTVHMAGVRAGHSTQHRLLRLEDAFKAGGRTEVRRQTVLQAYELMRTLIAQA